MNILYEDSMLFAHEYFSLLGKAEAFSSKQLTPNQLNNVDVLAVRSTTKITDVLLADANRLHTVATATAGIDHLNIPLLNKKGINWYAAAGCNAIAVAQYVISALMAMETEYGVDIQAITVGIIGAGKVGSALSKYLDALNINAVLCDPPIQHSDERQFVSLEQALSCDVISLHVPYTRSGPYPTEKLLCAEKLAGLKTSQWLINACRGEVIDEQALLALKCQNKGPRLVLDVWLDEPDINQALLPYVDIATPHIAGHTDEGKIRGTQMVFDYLAKQGETSNLATPTPRLEQFLPRLDALECRSKETLSQFLQRIYDIQFDHRIFLQNMAQSPAFSKLRKSYHGRREYKAFTIANSQQLNSDLQDQLRRLEFRLA